MITEKENLLQTMIRDDTEYQALLNQCLDIEPAYLDIRNRLMPEDQQILERYLSICEEMDHRKLYLALSI